MARRVTANRIFSASATEVVASTTIDSNGNFIVAPATNEAAITTLIDSNYVAARAPGGVDSNAITSLIDSDYVAARAPAGGGGGAVTKNYIFEGVLSKNTGTERIYFASSTTLTKIDGFVVVAPSGNNASFSINKNGTEAATVSITDGQTSTLNNTVSVSLTTGDYLTVDIDSIGTVYAGSDLQLILTFS